MKKIISLFQRNYDSDRLVRDEITIGAEWVINGEGIATRKWEGTCCMYKDGIWYKRYDAKHWKKPPEGFTQAQEPDEKTRHWPGWLKVNEHDKWHIEAISNPSFGVKFVDGTYELCGPKINANPEQFREHVLIKHGEDKLEIDYHTYNFFNHIRNFFIHMNTKDGCSTDNFIATYYPNRIPLEGIVWHHPDGRMVKIKSKDFGIARLINHEKI